MIARSKSVRKLISFCMGEASSSCNLAETPVFVKAVANQQGVNKGLTNGAVMTLQWTQWKVRAGGGGRLPTVRYTGKLRPKSGCLS